MYVLQYPNGEYKMRGTSDTTEYVDEAWDFSDRKYAEKVAAEWSSILNLTIEVMEVVA